MSHLSIPAPTLAPPVPAHLLKSPASPAQPAAPRIPAPGAAHAAPASHVESKEASIIQLPALLRPGLPHQEHRLRVCRLSRLTFASADPEPHSMLVDAVLQAREFSSTGQMVAMVQGLLDGAVASGIPASDGLVEDLTRVAKADPEGLRSWVLVFLRNLGLPCEDAQAQRPPSHRHVRLLTELAATALRKAGQPPVELLKDIVSNSEHFAAHQMGLMVGAACPPPSELASLQTLSAILDCILSTRSSDAQVAHMIMSVGNILGGSAMPVLSLELLLDKIVDQGARSTDIRFAQMLCALAVVIDGSEMAYVHLGILASRFLSVYAELGLDHQLAGLRGLCDVLMGPEMFPEHFHALAYRLAQRATHGHDGDAIHALAATLVLKIGGCDMPQELRDTFLKSMGGPALPAAPQRAIFHGLGSALDESLPPLVHSSPRELPAVDERILGLACRTLELCAGWSAEHVEPIVEGLARGLCQGPRAASHCQALLSAAEANLGRFSPEHGERLTRGLGIALGGAQMQGATRDCLVLAIASPRSEELAPVVEGMAHGLVLALGGPNISSAILESLIANLAAFVASSDKQIRTIVSAVARALGGPAMLEDRLKQLLAILLALRSQSRARRHEQMLCGLGIGLGGACISDPALQRLLMALADFYTQCTDKGVVGIRGLVHDMVGRREFKAVIDRCTRDIVASRKDLSGGAIAMLLQFEVLAPGIALNAAACVSKQFAPRTSGLKPVSASASVPTQQGAPKAQARLGPRQRQTAAAVPQAQVVIGWDDKGNMILKGQAGQAAGQRPQEAEIPRWGWGLGGDYVFGSARAALDGCMPEKELLADLAKQRRAVEEAWKNRQFDEVAALVLSIFKSKVKPEIAERRFDALGVQSGICERLKSGLRSQMNQEHERLGLPPISNAQKWLDELEKCGQELERLLKKGVPDHRQYAVMQAPQEKVKAHQIAKTSPLESKSTPPLATVRAHRDVFKWAIQLEGADIRGSHFFYPEPSRPRHFHVGWDFITLTKDSGGHDYLYKDGKPMLETIWKLKQDLRAQARRSQPMADLLRVIDYMCSEESPE